MDKTKLIKLLKSGNFTIIYWDSEEPTIYEGKWDKEKEYLKDDYEEMNKHEIDYFDWSQGYTPYIVELLVAALGGKSDSI